MALSKISLINAACTIIGADPIDAEDDDTPGAQIVAARYDSILDFMLGLHEWSFATSTRRLARRSDVAILNGWAFCFALPPDRVGQPLKVSPTADWPRAHFTDYLIEGGDCFANAADLYAQIRIRPPPSAMSATFRRTFETALAGELAMGLASDKALRAQLLGDAFGPATMNGVGGMMGAAIQADRRENPSRGPATAYDPLSAAHTGSGPYRGFSFP